MNSAHASSLAAKHAEIEARISDERHRPAPDAVRMATLKKQKLRIKETLATG